MSTIMKQEILSTPALLARTREACAPVCEDIVRMMEEQGRDRIFVAARGSSENAGLYFKYLCEIRSHRSVSILKASVITVYGSTVDMKDGILVVISQGGRGVDLRMIAQEAKRQGVPTVAVTNIPESPIGQLCDYILPLSMNLEQSMAATKSFTAEMYALHLLACAISGDVPNPHLAEAFERGLAKEDAVKEVLPMLDTDRTAPSPVYVLGRGKGLALAREVCCKLQETCLVSAFPFSAADFMHGPFALVERGSRVIVFHSKFGCYESTESLIEALLKQNADVLVITDEATDFGARSIVVKSHSEDESIFAMIAVLQLLAADLSELRGTDPDNSRNLSKYTETI